MSRWQQLDSEINNVTIGPDGRPWFQLRVRPSASQQDARRVLELEFKQPQPQVAVAELALLDGAGRAWFFFEDRQKLLGYDGTQWIEPTGVSRKRSFVGECPTRGQLRYGQLANASAGKRVFFFARDGILSFDDQKWDFLEFPFETEPDDVQFAASPNGQWIVASVGSKLMSLRSGAWMEEGEGAKQSKYHYNFLVVTNQGMVWHCPQIDKLSSFQLYEPADPDPATKSEIAATEVRIARWIRELDDEAFAVRNSAQAELIRCGVRALHGVESAVTATKSREVRERLQQVLETIKPRPQTLESLTGAEATSEAAGEKRATPVTPFGKIFVLRGASWLSQTDDDRLLLRPSETVDAKGKELGACLVVLDSQGQTKVCRDPYVRSAFPLPFHVMQSPILTPSGQVWAIGHAGQGAALIDLERDRIVDNVADNNHRTLRGVDESGRLYLTTVSPNLSARRVLVHSPQAPDDRLPIEMTSIPIESSSTIIASDGGIYTAIRDKGLSYFDGGRWNELETKTSSSYVFNAGLSGEVLIHNQSFALWKQGVKLASGQGSLQDFIKANRELFRKGFDGRKLPPSWSSYGTVVADAAGNIWLVQHGTAQVLVGDDWIDVTEQLRKGGMRCRVKFISAVGDGRRVYLSDLDCSPESSSSSFLAHIDHSAVVLSETPSAMSAERKFFRNREGELWIMSTDRALISGKNHIGRIWCRLNSEGVAERLEEPGVLGLIDDSGMTWTACFNYRGPHYAVVRDGERVVQTIELSLLASQLSFLSDRPGNVFALTMRGLEHFTAEGPDFDHYERRAVYSLGEYREPITFSGISSLGYIAFATADYDSRSGFLKEKLHLIRLPQTVGNAN